MQVGSGFGCSLTKVDVLVQDIVSETICEGGRMFQELLLMFVTRRRAVKGLKLLQKGSGLALANVASSGSVIIDVESFIVARFFSC